MVSDTDSLYVDDYNFMYNIFPLGTRWNEEEKRMKTLTHLKEEDEKRGELEDERTMKEIVKMANSICPIIQFVGNCPG